MGEREQNTFESNEQPRGTLAGIRNIMERIRKRLSPNRNQVIVVLGDQTPVGFPEKFAEQMGKLYVSERKEGRHQGTGFPEKFAEQMARFEKQVSTEETV